MRDHHVVSLRVAGDGGHVGFGAVQRVRLVLLHLRNAHEAVGAAVDDVVGALGRPHQRRDGCGVLELVAYALLLPPLQPDLVNKHHVVRLRDGQFVALRREGHLADDVVLGALRCCEQDAAHYIDAISLTFSAGLVENLSFRSPFSSNSCTNRSVVQTARRLPLSAQHTAVTLVMPGLGVVKVFSCLSCMAWQDFK